MVNDDRIDWFVNNPPEDTRAYGRALILRLAGPDLVDEVDWDFIRLKIRGPGGWPIYKDLDLANPLGCTRTVFAGLPVDRTALVALLDQFGEDTRTGSYPAQGRLDFQSSLASLTEVPAAQPKKGNDHETSRTKERRA